MRFEIAVLVSFILMIGISIITYRLGKKTSLRLIKYIPAISTAFGIGFFTIKLNWIPYHTHAFEAIRDIVAIILLGIIFTISFIGAIILELVSLKKLNKL